MDVDTVLQHEAVHGGAGRVGERVQLGRDRLEPHARRAQSDPQMIEIVRIVGEQQSLDAARAPVAVQDAEEQLGVAPLAAHVRFGRTQSVATRVEPLRVGSQPCVFVRVGDRDAGPELELEVGANAAEQAGWPVWPDRHATAERQRIAYGVVRRRDPHAGFKPVPGPGDARPELKEQPLHSRPRGDAGVYRIDRLERPDQVRLSERPCQRRGIPEHAGRNQVLDVRHRPVLERHVRRRVLGRRCSGRPNEQQQQKRAHGWPICTTLTDRAMRR